jgi:hypothetical protein
MRARWVKKESPRLAGGKPRGLALTQSPGDFSLVCLMLSIELMGAQLLEMLVASHSIKKTLDVIEDD